MCVCAYAGGHVCVRARACVHVRVRAPTYTRAHIRVHPRVKEEASSKPKCGDANNHDPQQKRNNCVMNPPKNSWREVKPKVILWIVSSYLFSLRLEPVLVNNDAQNSEKWTLTYERLGWSGGVMNPPFKFLSYALDMVVLIGCGSNRTEQRRVCFEI